MSVRSERELGAAAIMLLVVLPVHVVWSGFVLSVLWGYFIVPIGAAPIATAHAAGLLALVHFLRPHERSDDGESMFDALVRTIPRVTLRPLVLWGIGAVLHAWMT